MLTVGFADGFEVRVSEGSVVSTVDWDRVGDTVGDFVVALADGSLVGFVEGEMVGCMVGFLVGFVVGAEVKSKDCIVVRYCSGDCIEQQEIIICFT